MRWTKDQIKACIVHSDANVRRMAIDYFNGPDAIDPDLMPLVIQAVEKYGRDECTSLLAYAAEFPQTAETMDWLVRELNTERPSQDDEDEFEDDDFEDDDFGEAAQILDYHDAVDHCVMRADLDLVAARESEIVNSEYLPAERSRMLIQRLSLKNCDQTTAWRMLDEFCEARQDQSDVESSDLYEARNIVEVLARQTDLDRDRVVEMLSERAPSEDREVAWKEYLLVSLAGQARIEAAVPALLDLLDEEHSDETLPEACITALIQIGDVELLADDVAEYSERSEDFRWAAADLFKNQHSESSLQSYRQLLADEEDVELRIVFAGGLASQFDTECIDVAAGLIREMGVTWDTVEVAESVLTACLAMNYALPELDTWRVQTQMILNGIYGDDEDEDLFEDESLWDDDDSESGFMYQMPLGKDGSVPSNLVPPRLMEHLYQAPNDQEELLNAPPVHKQKVGRNDPCPCGSGKKFKACCLKK